MIYLKSALVGVLTAVVAAVIVIAALLRVWSSDGMVATYISIESWQIVLAVLVGFAAGFWWTFRRLRRVGSHPTLR
jgi:putative flippase GtrA